MKTLTKEEFNKLPIEKQIKYYNDNMSLGKTASCISREIGVDESTPRKKFAKRGYRLNKEKNKYILIDDKSMPSKKVSNKIINDKCQTTLIKPKEIIKNVDDNHDTSLIKFDDDNNNTLIINNELKKNLLNLAKEYSEFKAMLDWFKSRDDNNTNNVIEVIQGIDIDLPGNENIRTTIRINKVIWEAFNEFCDDNSHLNKQDLHAMALKEYIDKYKKEK